MKSFSVTKKVFIPIKVSPKQIFNRKLLPFKQLSKPKRIIEWGYKQLSPKMTKYTTKCLRDCNKCTKMAGCFEKKALLRPIPWYMWMTAGSALILPLLILLFPEKFVNFYAQELQISEPPEERKKRYLSLVEQMSLKYPQKIHFLESSTIPCPSAYGTDSIFGSVIILPEELMSLYHKDTNIVVGSFEGKVEELSENVKDSLLKNEGTLLPNPSELDYVLGHEIAHIKNSHSLETIAVVVSTLLTSHLSIKYLNKLAISLNRSPFSKLWSHTIAIGTTFAVVSFFHTWKREREADMCSAKMLDLAGEAVELAKKKAEQNKSYKRLANKFFITENGDNLLHLEHPPPSIQVKYLSSLIKPTK